MAHRVKLEDLSKLKLMFYGLPGSGKTPLACSAALDDRLFPCLYIDSGGNPISVRRNERLPDILALESISDLTWIYNWLFKGQPENDRKVQEYELLNDGKYKTFIFDGISHYQQMIVQKLSPMEVGDIPVKLNFNDQGTIYQLSNASLTKFAHAFLQLDMHVIITALEQETRVDPTNLQSPTMCRPLISGQAKELLPSYAHLISRVLNKTKIQYEEPQVYAQMFRDGLFTKAKNVAVFQADTFRYARDQYHALGAYMVDPTITKIFDLIYPS